MTDRSDPAGLKRAALSPADAGRGYLLSTEIGWNQTEADWAYMLENGPGLGLTDANGKLVASAMALPYGGFGWVCMVLVSLSRAASLAAVRGSRAPGSGPWTLSFANSLCDV